MKKCTHKLLVLTLSLGSLPYIIIHSSIQASAAKVATQASVEKKEVSTLQSENVPESISESETVLPNEKKKSDIPEEVEVLEKPDSTNETQETIDQEVPNQKEKLLEQSSRRTEDFKVTIEGVELPTQENYHYTNVSNLFFERAVDDEFSDEYQYSLSYNDVLIQGYEIGNSVQLGDYLDEGIYKVSMRGLTTGGDIDSGFFYNNVQRTVSSVDIDGVVNSISTVVENPSSITVGKSKSDNYGEANYSWIISGKDEEGNLIEIKGNDRQPTQDELNSLPTGDYIITNTVTEKLPDGYVSTNPITDTTQGAFKITAGKVIVEHILLDKNGNEIKVYSRDDTTHHGKIGTEYATSPIDISGYELVHDKMPKNKDGNYTTSDQIVKYYYKKVMTNITVEYIDKDGNSLRPSDKITGEYEDSYITKPKEIPGYDLDMTPSNANGTHTEKDQTVTYEYKKKKTEVNVNYVDEKGKLLASCDKINGLFNDPYTTKPKKIPGYILTAVPNNATGNHTVESTNVTYVYKKIEPPKVDDTLEGSPKVTGTGTPATKVTVTFPNGSEVTVDVDLNGNWEVAVPNGITLKKDDKIIAVTLDPLTGTTSDISFGNVIPLKTTLPQTNTVAANTNKSNTMPTTYSKNELPTTGETTNTGMVSMGLLSLILAFFGKYLSNRKSR